MEPRRKRWSASGAGGEWRHGPVIRMLQRHQLAQWEVTVTDNSELDTRNSGSIERTFGLGPVEGLPAALGAALIDLSRLAASMHPDDINLSLDLPAGILTFRAYRRERSR
jgi:hypothetical protein